MLQAIGLSKKQLIRMLCYEGMIYSLFAVLVTLILGVGLGILCIQIMRSLNPYFFYLLLTKSKQWYKTNWSKETCSNFSCIML